MEKFMMEPESFAKRLIELLKSKLSRKLEFDYMCVVKTNDFYKPALVVREPECHVGKTIYIEGLFKKHIEEGTDLEEIAEGIKNICEENSDFEKIITADLFDKMKNLEFSPVGLPSVSTGVSRRPTRTAHSAPWPPLLWTMFSLSHWGLPIR